MLRKNLYLAPLMIISTLSIVTVTLTLYSNLTLTESQSQGLIALILNLMIHLIHKKTGIVITGIILVVGIFKYLTFSPHLIFINIFGVSIDLINVLILVLYIIFFPRKLYFRT